MSVMDEWNSGREFSVQIERGRPVFVCRALGFASHGARQCGKISVKTLDELRYELSSQELQ
jgi:hypothetical protein